MAEIKWKDLNSVQKFRDQKSKWSQQCKHAHHLKKAQSIAKNAEM